MEWTPDFAYAVGLIASDGCLSSDGRHIDFTSKDIDQIQNFRTCLNLTNKIGTKSSSAAPGKRYYRVQFGNVKLYRFLIDIGLSPNKSKTLTSIAVPDFFFRDFMRGMFDGDGYTYSYWDPRWKSSFMIYLGFTSGSKVYLEWLKGRILTLYKLTGKIRQGTRAFQLVFAKKASINLFKVMYYKDDVICLKRKNLKIAESLGIIGKSAEVLKLVNRLP